MASQAEITAKVSAMAADQVGVDPTSVVPATHFADDLDFDSLDTVDFAMKLEDEFEVSVPDDDVPTLRTVAQVVDYVIAHTPKDAEDGGAG